MSEQAKLSSVTEVGEPLPAKCVWMQSALDDAGEYTTYAATASHVYRFSRSKRAWVEFGEKVSQ